MVSNHRFYSRRAAEESARAGRALTPAARNRHSNLAVHFLQLAQETDPVSEATSQCSRDILRRPSVGADAGQ
jgi:hypothetical protein